MSDRDEPLPLDQCTLPGAITVTRPALELAEQFQSVVPSGWIVAFSWYDGGGIRASKDAPLVDTGPGIDLVAYRPDELPPEAVYHDGSFRYAVLIRKEIVDAHPEKTIDLAGPRSVVLR